MCFGCVGGDSMSQIGCIAQVLFEKQVIALKWGEMWTWVFDYKKNNLILMKL